MSPRLLALLLASLLFSTTVKFWEPELLTQLENGMSILELLPSAY